MSETLLPCPFCGKGLTDVDGPLVNYGIRRTQGEVHFVVCCMVQTDDFDTEAEAIAAWNRRVPTNQQERE